MRIFRFITGMTIITLFSLVYVHQQIESVKLSYGIESREARVKDLLDRREVLRYNINNLESPSRLERSLICS